MNHKRTVILRWILPLAWMMSTNGLSAADLQPKTLKAWETYRQLTEKRVSTELEGTNGFLEMDFKKAAEAAAIRNQLKSGQVYIEKLKTTDARGKDIDVDDGMIHHWYGAIFIPNVSMDRLLQWIQNYDQHSRYFNEVEKSKLLSREGDAFKIFLRFVRKKVVTVHYNTEHTAVYRRHDSSRVSSYSIATRIAQLDDVGTPREKERPVEHDSGYMWRLNSYWRFRAEDGGVVIECESISLSRSIPWGVGWLVKGFVESVPRESLEATLTQIRDGVQAGRN